MIKLYNREFSEEKWGLFSKFLNENGITYLFNKYLINLFPMENQRVENSPDEYINYAFDWEETSEGYPYWSDMNKKWHAYLKYYNKLDGLAAELRNCAVTSTQTTCPHLKRYEQKFQTFKFDYCPDCKLEIK